MKNLIGPKEALSRLESFKTVEKPECEVLSKVPAVTLGFWIIKIAATTLGETGGDSVTMTLDWGYLAGTALFLALLIILVLLQIRAKKFRPLLYWTTIVASTTFGTTMADFADRRHWLYRRISTSLAVFTGGAGLVVLVGANDFRQYGQHPKSRNLLLDRDHSITNSRYCAGRLARRHRRAWVSRRRDCFCDCVGDCCRALLVERHFARCAVLGRLHFDAALGSHCRRLFGQTDRRRRSCAQ